MSFLISVLAVLALAIRALPILVLAVLRIILGRQPEGVARVFPFFLAVIGEDDEAGQAQVPGQIGFPGRQWRPLDLKADVVSLSGEETKTGRMRLTPIRPALKETLLKPPGMG